MNKILKNYLDNYVVRYNQDHILHYFSSSDFPPMQEEKISFINFQGLTLNGKLFYYEKHDDSKLIVFVHGIGPGYIAYMKEINELCKRGYQVLAYDTTGCESSEGENIRGLAQSLADLDSVLSSVKKDERFKNKKIYIIGHSWGGYAASNILNYQSGISGIIVISGFVSLEMMLKQKCTGIEKIGIPLILSYEKKMNKNYYFSSSLKALKKAECPVLVMHSLDDHLVKADFSFNYLKKRITNKNVSFVSYSNKKHNPNYTEEALNYMLSVFKDYGNKCQNGTLKSTEEKQKYMNEVDWERMTKQDCACFDLMENFLK